MTIEIKYTLATEGNYHVCRSFRTLPDQIDNDGHYVYTGCATFEHETAEEICSKHAIYFLWKLLYTGIFGASDELLGEFYHAIDALCKFILSNSAASATGCSRHIPGVRRDSEISVRIFNH